MKDEAIFLCNSYTESLPPPPKKRNSTLSNQGMSTTMQFESKSKRMCKIISFLDEIFKNKYVVKNIKC